MSLDQFLRRKLHVLQRQFHGLSTTAYSPLSHSNKSFVRLFAIVMVIVTLFVFSASKYTETTGTSISEITSKLDFGSITNSFTGHISGVVNSVDTMIDSYSFYEAEGLIRNDTVAIYEDSEETGASLIDFDREHVKYISPELVNNIYSHIDLSSVDWTKYAYVLYATSSAHLCNSFMIFAELRQYGSQADMVMIVNEDFLNNKEKYAKEYEELMRQKEKLRLIYKPTPIVTKTDVDPGKVIWISSFTKLLVFGETQYDRIIYMDADAVLTKSHLDELFFIPPCKLAAPSGYWLTQEIFDRDHAGMLEKYPVEKYRWIPLTVQDRALKIWEYTQSFIKPFLVPESEKLSGVVLHHETRTEKINVKNYQNSLYNNLPDYHTLDEFLLTNIIMVIQPDQELFNMVKKGIDERSQDEFDMDIMQRLFELNTVIKKQKSSGAEEKTFDDRLNETPEFIILPATAYGTLTSEFNDPGNHVSFAADPVDHFWATNPKIREELKNRIKTDPDFKPPYFFVDDLTLTPGEYLNKQVKYLHFSDAPIPKPWFYFDPRNDYMAYRLRCPSFREFVEVETYKDAVKPGRTDDCTAAEVWEHGRNMFEKFRLDVCGLPLIKTDKNTYFDIIN